MSERKRRIVQHFAHDDLALHPANRRMGQQRVLDQIVEVRQAGAKDSKDVISLAGQGPSGNNFGPLVHKFQNRMMRCACLRIRLNLDERLHIKAKHLGVQPKHDAVDKAVLF